MILAAPQTVDQGGCGCPTLRHSATNPEAKRLMQGWANVLLQGWANTKASVARSLRLVWTSGAHQRSCMRVEYLSMSIAWPSSQAERATNPAASLMQGWADRRASGLGDSISRPIRVLRLSEAHHWSALVNASLLMLVTTQSDRLLWRTFCGPLHRQPTTHLSRSPRSVRLQLEADHRLDQSQATPTPTPPGPTPEGTCVRPDLAPGGG